MKKFLSFCLVILILGVMVKTNVISQNKVGIATFAGGCFWCMEPPYEKLEGVLKVVAGYTGGTSKNPTYANYAKNGHIEAVQITYNTNKISYKTLLDIFWHQIDPTDANGQFVDRGPRYQTARTIL